MAANHTGQMWQAHLSQGVDVERLVVHCLFPCANWKFSGYWIFEDLLVLGPSIISDLI
jgi:hypothetical protein